MKSPATPTTSAFVKALGLNDPLPLQYLHYLGGLLTGDLGSSFLSGQPVALILARAIPITVEIALLAAAFAIVVGVPLGVISAVKPNSRLDAAARVGGLIGLSLPNFWVATLGLLISSVVFRWIPSVTWIPFLSDPVGNLAQIALPAFALSLATLAIVMRMTRASLLEVLNEDFVRTARAKGIAPGPVVFGHALRNALIPVITVVGAQVAAVYLAAVFILVNLGVDLLYGVIDPRIKQH